ncbi:EamA family transporter [Niabella insulamsoli]|uniref:EamA family transporter n=1 Tax=Niabella insulamsoli TaxID=3144874 RepID=UPI0031FC3855
MDATKKSPSLLIVVLAFAAVYLIWGSTYFFIEMAVKSISPMILGAVRFIVAGLILMAWVSARGEKIWNRKALMPAMISGTLMLFLGNGAVIWAEQFLPSSFVAIFLASAPLWFLLLDKVNWQQNFSNRFTLIGVSIGLLGVIALFYEKIVETGYQQSLAALIILCLANISWALGSLFSKYKVKNTSSSVNSAWQMLAAGLAFTLTGLLNGEFKMMQWTQVPVSAWLAVAYLVLFGSIIGYSAYVFLLSVRSATQVSTYAYVNPLVAVLLGVFINHDRLTAMQLGGLAVILCSVFFINLAKKRQVKMNARLGSSA